MRYALLVLFSLTAASCSSRADAPPPEADTPIMDTGDATSSPDTGEADTPIMDTGDATSSPDTADVDTGEADTDAPDTGVHVGLPGPLCETAGAAGHVQLVATYWAASSAYGDHLDELGVFPVAHVDPSRLSAPLPDDVELIVDLHWQLFDYTSHTLRADVDAQLDALATLVSPIRDRVRAFYLIDEPYLAGHGIPRAVLEAAVGRVGSWFPDTPTYITFAHQCFDPASTDAACTVPSADRGIPAGLDWVGFDWYTHTNDPAEVAAHVPTYIETGVDAIQRLAPDAQVVIVPEAYTDASRDAATVVSVMHDYFALAQRHPGVFGVDFFLWADVPDPPGFAGMRSLPGVRHAAAGFARWVAAGCGATPGLIPITQWYDPASPDYRYEPWVWDGRAAGYRVDGAVFALAPLGTAGTVPLYRCLIDRGTATDSMLTADPSCEGAPLREPAEAIGGIFTAASPETVPLHRYGLETAPWDHVFALSDAAPLPDGYVYGWPIGWVYPPAALDAR